MAVIQALGRARQEDAMSSRPACATISKSKANQPTKQKIPAKTKTCMKESEGNVCPEASRIILSNKNDLMLNYKKFNFYSFPSHFSVSLVTIG